MRQIGQKMRFSDQELGLIKQLFADHEDLLFAIRKSLLQFELSTVEENMIRDVMKTQTIADLIKKVFLPDLDGDSPLFQMTDMLLGLGADIKALNPDLAWPHIKAKETEIDYIAQQLEVLNGKKPELKIKLSDLGNTHRPKTTREAVFSDILARNFLLSFIDSNIQQIKFLAGMKDETVEQTKERLAKNSAK